MKEALEKFLGEPVASVEPIPGGFSNLTYLVQPQNLVLRRPPPGANIKTAHDMGREFRMLSALHPAWGKVPRPVVECSDESVIGAPFYLMERVEGVILRGRGNARCTPEVMRSLSRQLVDLLKELHGLELPSFGKPEGYVARQVSGWSERWQRAGGSASPVPEWLAANQPAESGACLIHNDFKYDNLVLSPDLSRIVAVLDWEMATTGDPLMDLGTTLGYWLDPDDPPELLALAFGPTFLAGNLSRSEVAERYGVGEATFYYVFGLFKIAVIAQQIYARYLAGHTTDPRFQHLNVAVDLLMRRARCLLS